MGHIISHQIGSPKGKSPFPGMAIGMAITRKQKKPLSGMALTPDKLAQLRKQKEQLLSSRVGKKEYKIYRGGRLDASVWR